MIHLILGISVASFSLAIIRNKDAFFSCPAKIKAFFVAFPASRLIPARAVDRFSAVCLASARSRI
jgi:hypothetical protein